MVEKIEHETNVIELLRSLTIKITGKDLKNNLLMAERKREFRNCETDVDKINYLLENSEIEIILEHEKFVVGKKLKSLKYDAWKEHMLRKFSRTGTMREFVRIKQRKEENCLDYLTRVRKFGEEISNNQELIFEVGLNGLFKNREDIEKMAINYRAINDEFLEAVKRIEEVNIEAYLRRKKAQEKKDNFGQKKFEKKREMMNVEEERDLNKNERIYFFGRPFRLIKDTGSYYNFVTKKLLVELNIEPKILREPFTLYTCLHEPFTIEEAIELEFVIGTAKYRDIFCVMPKREDETAIVGRKFLNKQQVIKEEICIKSSEEAIKLLCKEKKEGVKDFVCEINTEKNKRVTDVPHKIPQAWEKGVEEEVQRLMDKGYIRNSKSSWLNNVRPVPKADGQIRLTTNLIKLNKLVEKDSYSLPYMEEILSRLRNKKIFSKIDLKEAFFQVNLREEDKMKTAFRIKKQNV